MANRTPEDKDPDLLVFPVAIATSDPHFLDNEKVEDALAHVTLVNMKAFPTFELRQPVSGLEQSAILNMTYRIEWSRDRHGYTLALGIKNPSQTSAQNQSLIFQSDNLTRIQECGLADPHLGIPMPTNGTHRPQAHAVLQMHSVER